MLVLLNKAIEFNRRPLPKKNFFTSELQIKALVFKITMGNIPQIGVGISSFLAGGQKTGTAEKSDRFQEKTLKSVVNMRTTTISTKLP